ncbi:hypothetical protein [Halorubrum laminariae]|uniref:Right handed beta helix domain-containing protein n=1 Tax=Halorubrum laminariae TaxID=1433523 RepID=A0ABD6C2D2_9EURY|nr:hypothetical protein [Halorubrum laminariae]
MAGSAAGVSIDGDTVTVAPDESIQTGIDEAIGNDSVDTVQIEGDHTLDSSIVIAGPGAEGLTIESAGSRSDTTISYSADDGTPTFAIDADGVTVRDLTIERGGESTTVAQGVRVAASSVEVSGNVITSTNDTDQTDNGVIVTDENSSGESVGSDVAGVTVLDNEINGFPVGVAAATQTGENTVSDLTISGNDLYSNGVGVGLSQVAGAADFGDQIDIDSNTFDGNGVGVYVFGEDDSEDDGLTFDDARTDGVSITNNDFLNPNSDLAVDGNAYHVVNNGNEMSDDAEGPVPSTFVDENGQFDGAVQYDDNVVSPAIQPVFDNFVEEPDPDDTEQRTVRVFSGVYNERVTIDTPNVTLEGPNAGEPGTSDNRDDEAVISTDDGTTQAVTVTAPNVIIDGVQVDGPARTGISIDNTNNVSGLTVANTQITDIESTASDQNYNDGRAIAAYLDGDGEASDIAIENTLIDGVSNTEGGDERARGISVNTQGTDVSGLEIRDNVISNVEVSESVGDGVDSAKADGVQLNVELDTDGDDPGSLTGAVVDGNTIEGLTADKATGVRLAEDGDFDSDDGPRNFAITNNTVNDVTGDTDENAIAVGGYSDLGDYDISQNNLSDGAVEYYAGDSATLDATENYWGSADGPDESDYTSNVDVNPWLTSADGEADIAATVGDEEFSSIQSAVTAADEYDTVEVNAGTYDERVTINTPNVTLEGPNEGVSANSDERLEAEEATIEGQISVNADNVTVDGVEVSPDTEAFDTLPAAAIIVGESNATIQNNRVGDIEINITDIEDVDNVNSIQGIQIYNADTELTGITVHDNLVENVSFNGSSQATSGEWGVDFGNLYGIHVQGEIGNAEVRENTLRNLNSDGYVLGMAVSGTDSNDDANPENVNITQNTLETFNAEGAPAEGVVISSDRVNADYESIKINRNSLDVPVDIVNYASESPDARLNYYGDDVPTVTGNAVYDPVLTTAPSDLDVDSVEDTTEYGSVLEVKSDGEAVAVGFTAPSEEPVSDLFSDVEFESGAAAYRYDVDSGFELVSNIESADGDYTPNAGEVIVIATDSAIDDEIVVPIDVTETDTESATEVDINSGWNLVPTGAADGDADGNPDIVVRDGSILETTQELQEQPEQVGAPYAEYGAFDGTWVYVERTSGDNNIGLLTGYAEGQSAEQYYQDVLNPNDEESEE